MPATRTGATSAALPATSTAQTANSAPICPSPRNSDAIRAATTTPTFSAQPATTLAAVSCWASRARAGSTANCAGRVVVIAVLASTASP